MSSNAVTPNQEDTMNAHQDSSRPSSNNGFIPFPAATHNAFDLPDTVYNTFPNSIIELKLDHLPKRRCISSRTTVASKMPRDQAMHHRVKALRPQQKQTQDLQLIPQNTLVGLPSELLFRTIGFAVKQPNPINLTDEVYLRDHGWPTQKAATLKSFAIAKPILNIATAEYYRANHFTLPVTVEAKQENEVVRVGVSSVSLFRDAERVRHLSIIFPMAPPDEMAKEGMHSSVLWAFPGSRVVLQPFAMLRSLTLVLQHDACEDDDEFEWVNADVDAGTDVDMDGEEVEQAVIKAQRIASAIKKATASLWRVANAGLRKRSIRLVQVVNGEDYEVVGLDGRGRDVDELVWEMMDWPVCEVRLQ